MGGMSEVETGFSLNLEVKKEKKNARKRVKACFFFHWLWNRCFQDG
jgi:hypothetical protein